MVKKITTIPNEPRKYSVLFRVSKLALNFSPLGSKVLYSGAIKITLAVAEHTIKVTIKVWSMDTKA